MFENLEQNQAELSITGFGLRYVQFKLKRFLHSINLIINFFLFKCNNHGRSFLKVSFYKNLKQVNFTF